METERLFRAANLETMSRFVAESRQEDLHLEFKTVSSADFTQQDKQHLARALSGFANADGGLVVWGVDARRGPDGVDCAQGLRPVERVRLFHSRLLELCSDGASPVVENVRHRVIRCRSGTDEGFVITLVPSSDGGPHMAKFQEDRYFKRNGSKFIRMEHFDVADMFGRRRRPCLRVVVRCSRRNGEEVRVLVSLKNSGRGLACAPYLAIALPQPLRWCEFGVDGNCNEGLPRLRHSASGHQLRYGAGLSQVIHPGTDLDVFSLWNGRDASYGAVPGEPLALRYDVAAEDMPLVSGEVSLDFA